MLHKHDGASPVRIDSGLAGVRQVMTRCARALQRTSARGAATGVSPRNRRRCGRRPLDDAAFSDMAQGKILEGEATATAAEDWEESEKGKRWSRRVIIEQRLPPDQSREINHLRTGRVLARHREAVRPACAPKPLDRLRSPRCAACARHPHRNACAYRRPDSLPQTYSRRRIGCNARRRIRCNAKCRIQKPGL